MSIVLFLFNFILTNIIFGLILCSCLIRLDKNISYSSYELLLYSFGLGPALTSLFLYYLLLLVPHVSNGFYVIVIISIYAGLLWFGRKDLLVAPKEIRGRLKFGWKKYRSSSVFPKMETLFFILFFFLLILFFLHISSHILLRPLTGNDILEYAAQGKALFSLKHIEFRSPILNTETGFYRPSFHAPGFSLLLTWEMMIDSLWKSQNDLYFKCLSLYFGLLIILLQAYWLSRKSKRLALLGTVALLTALNFFYSFLSFHIDTYRIFFLMVAWIYLAYALDKKDSLSFLLLGVFSGLAAFAHSLGVPIALLTGLVFFAFLRGNFLAKLKAAAFVGLTMLACGGLHYVIDLFWGAGWILPIWHS